MTSFVKSLDPGDYADISSAVDAITHAVSILAKHDVRIDIGHPHRLWEYGSAFSVLQNMWDASQLPRLKVLDVGSGCGALGPSLSYLAGLGITEAEPDPMFRYHRTACNLRLKELNKPSINVVAAGVENLPQEEFDAVFCISVLEHVDRGIENQAWRNLMSRVKPNGVLFLTVDCVPDANRHYVFDNLRQTNYTPQMLAERASWIGEQFTPLGKPDFEYHGSHVHDYTFFRMGFVKHAPVLA